MCLQPVHYDLKLILLSAFRHLRKNAHMQILCSYNHLQLFKNG
jgi:hypothetical protein